MNLLLMISSLQVWNHPDFQDLDFLRKHYFCDAHKMETNYDILRIPDLRVLAREHKLRGYSRLRKAELIAFLRDNLRPMSSPRPPLKPIPAARPPSKPLPAPRPPQLVKLQPKCTRPPKPMIPPPLPPEDSLDPYEMAQAFGRAHQTFLKETRGSVADLITKELQDLDSAKVQTAALTQF